MTASPRHRKSTDHEPRLWGMALAPRPPHPQRNQKSSQHIHKNNKKNPLPEPPRGMALILVLTMLVLATTLVLELQFDTRVQLQMAANSRNALQAEYLARSALEFTHLLLAFNSQFAKQKKTFAKFLKSAPPEMQMLLNRLQIWKIVPLNSGLLKQIAGGAFTSRQREDDAEKPQDSSEPQGKLYPFGDFMGRFSASLQDESSKLNLNLFFNANDARVMRRQLTALFAPEKYNPLFERRRADGEFITREEQISAIQDWVDLNTKVAHQSSSDEESKYRYEEHGYFSKNGKFYSLEELRLVFGIDDLFFQTFSPFFTVFGRRRININEAPQEVLAALIESYAILPPQRRAIFRTPPFHKFMQALMLYRSYLGFADSKAFIRWCANPTVIDPRLFGGTAPQQMMFQGELPKFKLNNKQMIKDQIDLSPDANTFRVEAVGQVGTVKRTITAVIYVNDNPPRRDMIYWRLH